MPPLLAKINSHREQLFLLLIIVLAFLVRVWHLPTDLLFHRDQGLHSLSIWNIWHERKLSLLGHPSDVDGLTHAPIYYWLMLPAYALSGGDPVVASLFQVLFEVLSLPFLYFAVKKLFSDKVATLTLVFYTFSYGLVSYSRWLVNVTPIWPLSNLLLFLLVWLKNSYSSPTLFVSSFIVGIITQLNAAIGPFLLPLIFWFQRKKLNPTKVALILLGFLLPALPLFIFELRHQFVITKAVSSFFQGDGGLGFPGLLFINNFNTLIKEVTHLVSYPLYWLGATLFVWGLFSLRKLPSKNFIIAYLLIPFLSLCLFKRGAIGFFFVTLLPLSLAIIVHGLTRLPSIFSLASLVFLLGINLSQLPNIYQPNNALIPIGDANVITIQDRKNIVDWIYTQADGQPFSIWFYTLPYYQEEVWDYMLLWYANDSYHYLPEKTSSFSASDLSQSQYFFSVWEKDEDQPTKLDSWQQQAIAEFGEVIETYQSHDLTVFLHTYGQNK